MEMYSFLPSVALYSIVLIAATLLLFVPNQGKKISHWLLVVGTASFWGLIFDKEVLQLTEVIILDTGRIGILKVVTLFVLGILSINLCKNIDDVKNSLVSCFVFFGSFFLLGATEFITFYLAIEFISLLVYALVGISKFKYSTESAVKYFFQGSISSVFLLLGIAFFFGATGSLGFVEFEIINHQFYAMFLVFFICVTFFKMGAFPFHFWMPDTYSNIGKGPLLTSFLISKFLIGYIMIMMAQKMLNLADIGFQEVFVKIIMALAIISAFYGNIMGLTQKQFKRILAYSSVAHAGYMLMTLGLNADEGYENQLIFYLMFYSLSAAGALCLINLYLNEGNDEDMYQGLAGGFYRNHFAGFLLTVFTLSLAGIPLTSGFTTKFLIFTNYFREGIILPSIVILLSSAIGLGFYLKIVVALFVEKNTAKEAILIPLNLKLLTAVLFVIIILGGVYPSLFLK